jgi:uncharacterized protein (DUF697 family)
MIDDLLGGVTSRTYSSDAERQDAAKRLTERCGYAAAALTLLPIPLTEYLAVMPIHVAMVMGIGHVHGVEMTKETATNFLVKLGATVGMSLVGSKLATTAAKILLPGFGGILGAPFIYASTIALGTVARVYFEQQGNVSDQDLKAIFEKAKKDAKTGFDPAKAKQADAQQAAQAAARAANDGKDVPAPAAAAQEPQDPVSRLEKLKEMRDRGLLDKEEFDALKKKILAEL